MNNKSMIYLIFTIFQNCFCIKISIFQLEMYFSLNDKWGIMDVL